MSTLKNPKCAVWSMLADGKGKIKPINGPLDAKRGVRPEGLSLETYGERYIDSWIPRTGGVWPFNTFRYCKCMCCKVRRELAKTWDRSDELYTSNECVRCFCLLVNILMEKQTTHTSWNLLKHLYIGTGNMAILYCEGKTELMILQKLDNLKSKFYVLFVYTIALCFSDFQILPFCRRNKMVKLNINI